MNRQIKRIFYGFILCAMSLLLSCAGATTALAATIEFNNTGGTSASNGLHFYIEDTTHIQVKRLNNTGQVYNPTAVPPSTSLDNGIFLRANGKVYGPGHNVTAFTPTGGMFNTYSISATTPANPSSIGVQQTATGNFGITSGPQVTVVWKYTTPLDFMTAEVTLVIPLGYAVSVANPVRYYHVFDTYLGGSDNGCGVKYGGGGASLVVGTYPPPGTTCTSSTSIPNGVSIVESFRERSGLSFSHYCASGWSTFFTGNTCSVLQNASMNDTIATTYQDTGIGIEYDFIAPGTYTFSYDFVIGSPAVPPYDHLEIQHNSAGSLCPENVTVLACKTAGVPCNASDYVNTGTLTGSLTATPASPAVTATPTTFTLGSGAPSATVVLQATAPGGAYVLGVGSLSSVPLNGIKCYTTDTNSNSCAIVFSNTPCVANFECMETGTPIQLPYNNLTLNPAARNPLYTKLAGNNFKFDVVALLADGSQAINYTATSNVDVELFDDTVPQAQCGDYSSPVASQPITFAASDKGRKTLSMPFNLPQSYKKLRCRVNDQNLNQNVYGCSSDDFAVRPSAPVLNTTALATPPSATDPTVIKAGVPFTLGASANPATYTGNLVLDTSRLTAQDPASAAQQNGGAVGNLYNANTSTNLVIGTNAVGVSNNASYSEVGYLYAGPGSFRDDSFTNVDLTPANCAATNTCDCVTSTTNNAYLSDVIDASGRYGCSIGNTSTKSFGRFIPDHFSVVKPATFNGFCAAGGFIYMDQSFNLAVTVEARNFNNVKTANYRDLFGRAAITAQMLDNTSPVALSRLAVPVPSPAWVTGAYSFVANKFSRLAAPDGPYDALSIGLGVTDPTDAIPLWDRDMDATNPGCTADPAGTSSSAAGACKAVKIANTKMRYGRLKLSNASGTELLPLPVPLRLEYWNAASGWNLNALDSCSSIAASDFAFTYFAASTKNQLAACETAITVSGVPPNQSAKLSAPGSGNFGWTDLTLNLDSIATGNRCVAVGASGPAATTANLPWLKYNWLGSGVDNPKARATFGIYKNASEFIYLRENH
ncbi:hypothetical protein LPB67_02765 [Undibacterium sp. Jales W-56]|uniref:DUF6701 domain-containing protein n=1 Tax=Undibacterium sp. Jales W-56 TaxID=2897325 RepID=UPI0021CE3501|nr:DUF6701 domain-containing protein [Undibacterium sp. Jales W-56]MCU6432698.1 hypothetical protein [Undibacterium sp. Jales W-56]